MKKTIQNLIAKLEVDPNGLVRGGFGSIKGGAAFNVPAPNDSCTNGDPGGGGTCSGTNNGTCTNNVSCKNTTNTTPRGCTNVATC